MKQTIRSVKMDDKLWDDLKREGMRVQRSTAWVLRAAARSYLLAAKRRKRWVGVGVGEGREKRDD